MLGGELGDPVVDFLLAPIPADEQGLILLDGRFLDPAEILDAYVLEFHREVFGIEFRPGHDGDVLEGGFLGVTEFRGLDGDDVEGAAELIDDDGRGDVGV